MHVCVFLQLQEMIRKEVRIAVKKKERKLRRLITSIRHLENEVNYEDVLKKLEVGGSSYRLLFFTRTRRLHLFFLNMTPAFTFKHLLPLYVLDKIQLNLTFIFMLMHKTKKQS